MAKRKARQVAALCWRRRKGVVEILLITSRETRRWVTPKGWPMDKLKDWTAAKREAFEEAGVEGRMATKPLGTFTYDKVQDGEAVGVIVTVYGLEVLRELKSWPERKERKRQWFAADEAARRVAEPGLRLLILALR
jgi:8-oxo-dGTP pyrophosphatase MutT (NUDIX family)